MSISAYHRDQKPVFIKAISIFIIVTFLVTQMDVQMAFGFTAPAPPVDLAKTEKIDLASDKEDIYFQQKMFGEDTGPLTPAEEMEPGVEEPREEVHEVAEIPESFFEISPLLRPEGEVTVMEEENRLTFAYANGSSFTVDPESGKLLEIRDFTDDLDAGRIEVRMFDYLEDDQGRETIRIHTISNEADQLDRYEQYSTDKKCAQ